MAISFNQISTNLRAPAVQTEFDSSQALSESTSQPYKVLLIGQKLSTGNREALIVDRISSVKMAKYYYGPGSQLARMAQAYFENNQETPVYAIGVDDLQAGGSATGGLNLTGENIKDGIIHLYIGGILIRVGVEASDTLSEIATKITLAVNSSSDCPLQATANSKSVDFVAKNKGEAGNFIPIILNYYDESLPSGLGVAIRQMSSGLGNPDIDGVLAVLSEEQYNIIAQPFTDALSLRKLNAHLESAWEPGTENDGQVIASVSGTYAELGTLGRGPNSRHICLFEAHRHGTDPVILASAISGIIAKWSSRDQARPVQNLVVKGVLPPKKADRFNYNERNLLLFDGISTTKVSPSGDVLIERVITTYRISDAGASDTSYLSLEPKLIWSRLRYEWRNHVLRKYPNAKLASDGTNFGAGQVVVTPHVLKAEILSVYRAWEELGLVEDFEGFKSTLIVERNLSNVDRLDMSMSPNAINQFRILGVKLAFIL